MESLVLCDSNVIINSINGDLKALSELTSIGSENILISVVTEWEILAGARNKGEQKKFHKLLKRFNIIQIDSKTSIHSSILLKTYFLSHGLLIPDAMIAATAIRHDLPLLTDNVKDFDFIQGLKLFERS